jgi:hypothetical protein
VVKYTVVSEEVQYVEVSAARLIGSQLAEVRYYGIPFGLSDARPWECELAHRVDYGVDLVTDRGTFGITWTSQEVVGYRIDCVSGPLLDVRPNEVQVSHVENAEPWASLIGSAVEAVEVHELSVKLGEKTGTLPTALTLTFASGAFVCFIGGSWDGDEKPIFPTGNDVVIVWKSDSLLVLAPFLTPDAAP